MPHIVLNFCDLREIINGSWFDSDEYTRFLLPLLDNVEDPRWMDGSTEHQMMINKKKVKIYNDLFLIGEITTIESKDII